MLPGKPAPELPTDQQCDHCRRFFRASGIESHEESCPVQDSKSFVSVDGEVRSSQCDHCGVWATIDGTQHREDCKLNTDSPDSLGNAVSILSPFDLPDFRPDDF
jgi:hypothetical protein